MVNSKIILNKLTAVWASGPSVFPAAAMEQHADVARVKDVIVHWDELGDHKLQDVTPLEKLENMFLDVYGREVPMAESKLCMPFVTQANESGIVYAFKKDPEPSMAHLHQITARLVSGWGSRDQSDLTELLPYDNIERAVLEHLGMFDVSGKHTLVFSNATRLRLPLCCHADLSKISEFDTSKIAMKPTSRSIDKRVAEGRASAYRFFRRFQSFSNAFLTRSSDYKTTKRACVLL